MILVKYPFTPLLTLLRKLQRGRVYSSDVGYVPRKVGLYGHLLEFCGGPIRKRMELLWRLNRSDAQNLTDLRLLGCLHGFPRTGKVPVFDPNLHCALHNATHGVLRVGSWEISSYY